MARAQIFLTTALLSLALIACGDDGSGAAPAFDPTTTAAPAATTVAVSTPAAADVLRFWPVERVVPPGEPAEPHCVGEAASGLTYCPGDSPPLGDDIVASADARELGGAGWTVRVELTPDGLNAFNELASLCFGGTSPARCNGQIAIEVDGEVVSAPTVHAPSFDGSVQIAGSFTQTDAVDLAARLQPQD